MNLPSDPANFEELKKLLEKQGITNISRDQLPQIEKLLSFQKPLKSNEVPKDFEKLLDKEGGILVEPDPCLVIKYKERTGCKVFVNICTHSLVEEPEEKELLDFENNHGVRVPMSVGAVKEDFDKC